MAFASYDRTTGKIRCTNSKPNQHDPEVEDQIEVDGYHYTHVIDGVPTVIEESVPLEILLHDVRRFRNNLLNHVDLVYCNPERWEQMTQEQKQAWRAYKQALRDFPSTCDLHNPVWPTPPQ